jgi:hypothetical protein
MSIFVNPVDTSTEEGDLTHLALQLRVAKELASCPATLEYIERLARSDVIELLDLDGLAARADQNIRTHLAKAAGQLEAYKHLAQLAATHDLIEQDYTTKTRGN